MLRGLFIAEFANNLQQRYRGLLRLLRLTEGENEHYWQNLSNKTQIDKSALICKYRRQFLDFSGFLAPAAIEFATVATNINLFPQ